MYVCIRFTYEKFGPTRDTAKTTNVLALGLCMYTYTIYIFLDGMYTYTKSVQRAFLDGYCSTVQGLLDWFEVDLGFTELLFIQIDLCVMCVCVPFTFGCAGNAPVMAGPN